ALVTRLVAEILVLPRRLLGSVRLSCRAAGRGRPWSRLRPTNPAPRSRRRGPGARRGCGPRFRRQTRRGGASTPSARARSRPGGPAKRSRTGSGRRSPRPPAGDPAWASLTRDVEQAAAARLPPTARRTTHFGDSSAQIRRPTLHELRRHALGLSERRVRELRRLLGMTAPRGRPRKTAEP